MSVQLGHWNPFGAYQGSGALSLVRGPGGPYPSRSQPRTSPGASSGLRGARRLSGFQLDPHWLARRRWQHRVLAPYRPNVDNLHRVRRKRLSGILAGAVETSIGAREMAESCDLVRPHFDLFLLAGLQRDALSVPIDDDVRLCRIGILKCDELTRFGELFWVGFLHRSRDHLRLVLRVRSVDHHFGRLNRSEVAGWGIARHMNFSLFTRCPSIYPNSGVHQGASPR
jgi:hypothetical protein